MGFGGNPSATYTIWGAGSTGIATSHSGFTIWAATMKDIKWKGKLTEETPLWEGTILPQVLSLQGFKSWDLIGITSLSHVLENGVLRTFQSLQEEYDLHKSQF